MVTENFRVFFSYKAFNASAQVPHPRTPEFCINYYRIINTNNIWWEETGQGVGENFLGRAV